ncbi:unnamed protein product [Periconia digitata]|uniref:CHK kinase-like domain-containing protein n=1 Tax=Periconia digitata TaxID=1303443 RepID=A0A9W4UEN9_9PLEO|nr:unnamed protein product [Periconia digitata]
MAFASESPDASTPVATVDDIDTKNSNSPSADIQAGTTPSSEVALPTIPSEITVAWLSKALDHDIQSVKVDKIVPGTASKIFVTVTYTTTTTTSASNLPPKTLCIKGGFDPTILKTMPWLLKIYKRECDFYTTIAPMLHSTMVLPRCWYAGHTSTQGIVIMDDLAWKGYSFGDPAQTWSVSLVKQGLTQLAALHAKTWEVQNDKGKEEKYAHLTSEDYDQAILTLMQSYDVVVNGEDRPNIQPYLRDQGRMTRVLEKHFAGRNPRFRCLLHGDAHTANTYLEGHEGEIAEAAPRFLDWQMIHVGSCFHDVAYFVGAAFSVDDRRKYEWDVLGHYLKMLENFGVQGFKKEDREVADEYKKGFLAGVGWIMCPYVMQKREFVFPMARRYAAALDDHKVIELVESMSEN